MASLLGLCLAACAALAQQPAPKPGPEVRRLAVFEGSWTGESVMKPGRFGPGGKFTSTDACTWFEGGFQLVCRGTVTLGNTKAAGVTVMGWSPEDKTYKMLGYNCAGMMMTAKGSVSGNTWIWNGEDMMGGKTYHSRYTVVETSPTSYTYTWETSEDGKTYWTVLEARSTKPK